MMSTKFWVILFAALLLCSGVALLTTGSLQSGGSTASIYVDGQLVETIGLSDLQGPVQRSYAGNTIAAGADGIRITHADCPDQLCVMQGTISNGLVPLVCLPNRLVVQIENAAAPLFDGVSS